MPNQFLDYEGLQLYTQQLKLYIKNNTSGLSIQQITYEELVALREVNGFTPRQLYRITNYVTTTNGKAADGVSASAEHPFDLLVQAISANQISPAAIALPHKNDAYFSNQKLENWVILYDINNSTAKYPWASSSGRGVIYYMKDEKNNCAGYDFKNIKFKRGNAWCYTFDKEGTDGSLTAGVYGNEIKVCSIGLNNIVFNLTEKCYNNHFSEDCYNNTFGEGCAQNTFNNKARNNVFGNDVYYNSFDYAFVNNTIGSYVRNNIFENWVANCTIGDYCAYNTFKNNTRYVLTPNGEETKRFLNTEVKAIGASSTNPLVLDYEGLFADVNKYALHEVKMDSEGRVIVSELSLKGFEGVYKESAIDTEWKPYTFSSGGGSEEWEYLPIPDEFIDKLFGTGE